MRFGFHFCFSRPFRLNSSGDLPKWHSGVTEAPQSGWRKCSLCRIVRHITGKRLPSQVDVSYKDANLPDNREFDEQRKTLPSAALVSDPKPKLKLNTSILMAEPFLGQLMCVGFNYAPSNWAFCQGQLLSIGQNSALFSLLGTTYGGNGTTTFALPDLRGRVPVGMGTGPGLPNVAQGESFGSSTTTILQSNLPAHAHGIPAAQVSGAACINAAATTNNPTGAYPAAVEVAIPDPSGGGTIAGTALAYATGTPTGNLAGGGAIPATSTGITGGSQPIDNQPPSLGLNWIIALQGVYPMRS